MNKNVFLSILAIVAILGWFIYQQANKPMTESPIANDAQLVNNTESAPVQEEVQTPKKMQKPELTIDQAKDYSAVLKTNMGDITIKLYADKTPITVNNFVALSNQKFYDGVIFHRVIPGFMIQGGDPTGTGRGGPGYQFEDEIVEELQFTKAGLLAMANAGPGTNGSQFFITLGKTDWLNGNHTIFGEVTGGMDVVEKIGATQTGAGDRPASDVVIETVEISEN